MKTFEEAAPGSLALSERSGRANVLRLNFFLLALGLIALMLGFGMRQPWATRLWVWDDARMSFIFLASIAAAVAAPALWVAVSGEFAAWAGVAINGVLVGTLMSVYLLSRVVHGVPPDALPTALVFLVLTPAALMALRWSRSVPVRDERPMPRFVRAWFLVFAVILVGTGGALLFQVDRIFPWNLTPATSTLFGGFFLGASAYFIYALRRQQWIFAAGALWSFLAYDIVLAIPYVRLLVDDGENGGYGQLYGSGDSGGDPVNELSLVLYLAVIVLSAVVALYTFFVHQDTRVIRPPGKISH